jgi:hypothetical protein
MNFKSEASAFFGAERNCARVLLVLERLPAVKEDSGVCASVLLIVVLLPAVEAGTYRYRNGKQHNKHTTTPTRN